MVFTVLAIIVLCPFSQILLITNTSFYVLAQDVSLSIEPKSASGINPFKDSTLAENDIISPIEGI
jgi:hypothetical protein